MAEMGSELLGQLRENRHIQALPALGFGDEDHLPLKEHLVGGDVHKLRHPGAGLEQRLDQQPSRALHPIRVCDELAFLLTAESGDDTRARFRPFDGKCAPHFLGDIAGLIVSEVVLTPNVFAGGDDRCEAGG